MHPTFPFSRVLVRRRPVPVPEHESSYHSPHPFSQFEESCLVRSLQPDVKSQVLAVEDRNQRVTFGLGEGSEQWIIAVRLRFVRKVDACDQPVEQTAREDGYIDVRRLRASVPRGKWTGLDGHDRVDALIVGSAAAKTAEGRCRVRPGIIGGI